jgi:hypothetical protein
MHPLQRAIEKFDTQQAFAKAIGKVDSEGEGRQSYVSMLMHRVLKKGRPVPTDICPAIEAATNGAVTRYELREDIFGPPPKRRGAA